MNPKPAATHLVDAPVCVAPRRRQRAPRCHPLRRQGLISYFRIAFLVIHAPPARLTRKTAARTNISGFITPCRSGKDAGQAPWIIHESPTKATAKATSAARIQSTRPTFLFKVSAPIRFRERLNDLRIVVGGGHGGFLRAGGTALLHNLRLSSQKLATSSKLSPSWLGWISARSGRRRYRHLYATNAGQPSVPRSNTVHVVNSVICGCLVHFDSLAGGVP